MYAQMQSFVFLRIKKKRFFFVRNFRIRVIIKNILEKIKDIFASAEGKNG